MQKQLLQNFIKILTTFILLTSFISCSSSNSKNETAGQFVDDSVITTRVKTAFVKDPDLKAMQINVKTYQGVVQLSGFVDSQKEVSKAEEVAKNVSNVKSVENDLIVK